jgi:PAS domain S-box-containing protein
MTSLAMLMASPVKSKLAVTSRVTNICPNDKAGAAADALAPPVSRLKSGEEMAGGQGISPLMLDLIRCGVALIEPGGRVTAANETAWRLAGLATDGSLDTVSTSRWRHLDDTPVDPADAPGVLALAGRPTQAAEFRIEGGDGVVRPVCAVAAPTLDLVGRISGAILFMRDDTQRVGQEHELRWRRDVLELILETVPVAVWITDRDNRILKINDGAARLFQIERHLAIGVDASEILAKFRESSPGQRGASSSEDAQPILEFQSDDDEKIYCRLARAEFKDPRTDAVYVLTAASDITPVKRAKDRLAAANSELDQFARAVSHDLQEPLRKLIIFSEFLEKDLADEDMDSAAADLDAIRTSAIRMRQLVADLLVLARAQENEISLVAVEPARCIDAAIANISHRGLAASPNFIFETLPPVRADATLLTQIYQNLISNALKFSPPDAAPVIRFTADIRGDEIILGVSDNGDGVPAEHRQRIFDPLVRLHRRDEVEGAGIGLAICEKAVKRLGGEIWVEPASPNGAHFRFSLASAGDRRRAA